jgi:superfamily II DNA or RNA helicase
LEIRNRFLRQANLSLGGLEGWQRFVQVSARSAAGREAMLAHHEAKAIALGNEGKLAVLGDLLAEHYPEQVLIFTHDNATVYRISQDFLIPAITHQTPVKERHEILTRFRENQYKTLVVANVLDEGVDVPDVRIAVFLAGSGSTRQFVQRLGRVLRRGSGGTKQAILYEVVAEDTVEESTSQRRRRPHEAARSPRQLELVPPVPYGEDKPRLPKAAEKPEPWQLD